MRNKMARDLLIILFCAVFLVSGGMLANQYMDYFSGNLAYNNAVELAEDPVPTAEGVEVVEEAVQEEIPYRDDYVDELKEINLATLRETQSDVIGWILIPGTEISYPLMQGEDNDYYLHHSWDGRKTSVGSIYMDCRNDAALGDFNTIIYGHNMLNGTMFTQLHMFKDDNFFESQPGIYILTEQGIYKYALYACYETTTGATYWIDFEDDSVKERYFSVAVKQYGKEPQVDAGVDDRILTLSTCTGNGHDKRWIVQGVLERVIDITEEMTEE